MPLALYVVGRHRPCNAIVVRGKRLCDFNLNLIQDQVLKSATTWIIRKKPLVEWQR